MFFLQVKNKVKILVFLLGLLGCWSWDNQRKFRDECMDIYVKLSTKHLKKINVQNPVKTEPVEF